MGSKAIFTHSNRFETKNGKYYSNGIFINDNMERYTTVFDKLTVIARKKKVYNVDKLVVIDNPKVKFDCIDELTDILKKDVRKRIEKNVVDSNYVIARAPSIMSMLVIHYAKKHKKPYLIEVVGNCFGALWYHSLKGKMLAPFEHIINKKIIKESKYTLYVTKDYLEKIYPTNGKYINCSNVELRELDDQVLKKRIDKIHNRKKDEPIIISTIASVEIKYKGQEYVIKALKELKHQGYNFKYKIVGNGNDARLKKMIQKYDLVDCVELIGGLPHKMIFEFLDNVDVYIQPSIAAEGLPRAMIEAMSRGCLCSGTNICGIPELIDEKYLFRKGNVKDIKNILKDINLNELEKQATINFNKSKEYEIELLKKRRKDFFEEFRDNNK